MTRGYSRKYNDNVDVYRTRRGKRVNPWLGGWSPR